jgi:hypothetical protein
MSDTSTHARADHGHDAEGTHANQNAGRKTAKKAKSASKSGGKTAKAKSRAGNGKSGASRGNFAQFLQFPATEHMETIMTQGKTGFDKLAREGAKNGQENLKAIVESGTVAAGHGKEMFDACMELAQECAERNALAFKSLLGCKTLNEFTETQNAVAQETFDEFVTSLTKLSEMSLKMMTESFEPINEQITRSIRSATSSVAI